MSAKSLPGILDKTRLSKDQDEVLSLPDLRTAASNKESDKAKEETAKGVGSGGSGLFFNPLSYFSSSPAAEADPAPQNMDQPESSTADELACSLETFRQSIVHAIDPTQPSPAASPPASPARTKGDKKSAVSSNAPAAAAAAASTSAKKGGEDLYNV